MRLTAIIPVTLGLGVSGELDPLNADWEVVIDPLEPLAKCQRYEIGSELTPLQNHVSDQLTRCHLQKEDPPLSEERSVTIYFLRHAESTWNELTSKYIPGGIRESWINENRLDLTDAHLSRKGLEGSLEVQNWLEESVCDAPIHDENIDRCLLAGKVNPEGRRVLFGSSNLRRAVMTGLVAFGNRLLRNRGEAGKIESFHILSSMQEMTSNADSIRVTPEGHIPWLTFEEEQCPYQLDEMKALFRTECDIQDENTATEDRKRDILADFCWWVRQQAVNGEPSVDPNGTTGVTDFVLTGHSIWIRELFRRYLPQESDMWGKIVEWYHNRYQLNDAELKMSSLSQKMSNEGIVMFEVRLPEDGLCEIVPGSTRFVRGEMKKRWGLVR